MYPAATSVHCFSRRKEASCYESIRNHRYSDTGRFNSLHRLPRESDHSSFETADLTGWPSTGLTFATFTGNSGSYSPIYGAVGAPCYLYQTIATVPGESYTFIFWQETVGGSPNEFQAYSGGIKILDLVNSPASGHYTEYSFDE